MPTSNTSKPPVTPTGDVKPVSTVVPPQVPTTSQSVPVIGRVSTVSVTSAPIATSSAQLTQTPAKTQFGNVTIPQGAKQILLPQGQSIGTATYTPGASLRPSNYYVVNGALYRLNGFNDVKVDALGRTTPNVYYKFERVDNSLSQMKIQQYLGGGSAKEVTTAYNPNDKPTAPGQYSVFNPAAIFNQSDRAAAAQAIGIQTPAYSPTGRVPGEGVTIRVGTVAERAVQTAIRNPTPENIATAQKLSAPEIGTSLVSQARFRQAAAEAPKTALVQQSATATKIGLSDTLEPQTVNNQANVYYLQGPAGLGTQVKQMLGSVTGQEQDIVNVQKDPTGRFYTISLAAGANNPQYQQLFSQAIQQAQASNPYASVQQVSPGVFVVRQLVNYQTTTTPAPAQVFGSNQNVQTPRDVFAPTSRFDTNLSFLAPSIGTPTASSALKPGQSIVVRTPANVSYQGLQPDTFASPSPVVIPRTVESVFGYSAPTSFTSLSQSEKALANYNQSLKQANYQKVVDYYKNSLDSTNQQIRLAERNLVDQNYNPIPAGDLSRAQFINPKAVVKDEFGNLVPYSPGAKGTPANPDDLNALYRKRDEQISNLEYNKAVSKYGEVGALPNAFSLGAGSVAIGLLRTGTEVRQAAQRTLAVQDPFSQVYNIGYNLEVLRRNQLIGALPQPTSTKVAPELANQVLASNLPIAVRTLYTAGPLALPAAGEVIPSAVGKLAGASVETIFSSRPAVATAIKGGLNLAGKTAEIGTGVAFGVQQVGQAGKTYDIYGNETGFSLSKGLASSAGVFGAYGLSTSGDIARSIGVEPSSVLVKKFETYRNPADSEVAGTYKYDITQAITKAAKEAETTIRDPSQVFFEAPAAITEPGLKTGAGPSTRLPTPKKTLVPLMGESELLRRTGSRIETPTEIFGIRIPSVSYEFGVKEELVGGTIKPTRGYGTGFEKEQIGFGGIRSEQTKPMKVIATSDAISETFVGPQLRSVEIGPRTAREIVPEKYIPAPAYADPFRQVLGEGISGDNIFGIQTSVPKGSVRLRLRYPTGEQTAFSEFTPSFKTQVSPMQPAVEFSSGIQNIDFGNLNVRPPEYPRLTGTELVRSFQRGDVGLGTVQSSELSPKDLLEFNQARQKANEIFAKKQTDILSKVNENKIDMTEFNEARAKNELQYQKNLENLQHKYSKTNYNPYEQAHPIEPRKAFDQQELEQLSQAISAKAQRDLNFAQKVNSATTINPKEFTADEIKELSNSFQEIAQRNAKFNEAQAAFTNAPAKPVQPLTESEFRKLIDFYGTVRQAPESTPIAQALSTRVQVASRDIFGGATTYGPASVNYEDVFAGIGKLEHPTGQFKGALKGIPQIEFPQGAESVFATPNVPTPTQTVGATRFARVTTPSGVQPLLRVTDIGEAVFSGGETTQRYRVRSAPGSQQDIDVVLALKTPGKAPPSVPSYSTPEELFPGARSVRSIRQKDVGGIVGGPSPSASGRGSQLVLQETQAAREAALSQALGGVVTTTKQAPSTLVPLDSGTAGAAVFGITISQTKQQSATVPAPQAPPQTGQMAIMQPQTVQRPTNDGSQVFGAAIGQTQKLEAPAQRPSGILGVRSYFNQIRVSELQDPFTIPQQRQSGGQIPQQRPTQVSRMVEQLRQEERQTGGQRPFEDQRPISNVRQVEDVFQQQRQSEDTRQSQIIRPQYDPFTGTTYPPPPPPPPPPKVYRVPGSGVPQGFQGEGGKGRYGGVTNRGYKYTADLVSVALGITSRDVGGAFSAAFTGTGVRPILIGKKKSRPKRT